MLNINLGTLEESKLHAIFIAVKAMLKLGRVP